MADPDSGTTVRSLYERIASPGSVSYDAFRKRLKRLAEDRPATWQRIERKRTPYARGGKRTFVAYDGEGWGSAYTLLGNSLGEYVANSEGLTTQECLDFLSGDYAGHVKRVFFAFGYDVNHILKDLSDEQAESVLSGKVTRYLNHTVQLIPGKILTVDGYKFYDVFSFFATSFINVVGLMLGEDRISDSLREGKANRGKFEEWDMERIIAYNAEELALLVEIMERLDDAFTRIGVRLTEWYGPGAVAKYWFREHGIMPRERHTPGTIEAVNAAYYGGRFEQPVLGLVRDVHEYDLHSAYPSVMATLPYFRSFRKLPPGTFTDDPHSIYEITFDIREEWRKPDSPKAFMPLPVRDHDGRIAFPMMGRGWYWQPEIRVLMDYFPGARVTFHEGYVASTEGQPFSWVADLYDYRQRLKSVGDLSQYAIKVGLNSLYGKTAQRVGNNRFFSLSWAGYITSATRAKLARAAYEGGSEHVLGFATDAIFTDRAFNLPLSDRLGDWGEEHFREATFFQSGIYRTVGQDGKIEDRYRGSPLRHGIDALIEQLTNHPDRHPSVSIARFISRLLAMRAPHAYGALALQFVQVRQSLAIDAPYKRHYEGFLKRVTRDGKPVHDYGRLLRQRIESRPKVFIGDNDPRLSDEYLRGDMTIGTYASQRPPMKDQNTARLLEEAELIGIESGYDDTSRVELLTIVEEDQMA